MRPYMCWCGDPAEGAVLAWANTAQEARKLSYPVLEGWWDGCEFIDVRANWLREHPDYYETLKQKDAPHVIESPPCCPVCERWGSPPLSDGDGCESCDGSEGY